MFIRIRQCDRIEVVIICGNDQTQHLVHLRIYRSLFQALRGDDISSDFDRIIR
jgi:hypothetical protein